ncbi:MAG: hypothetical protein KA956_06775 [Pyrinomonadaceae bacterium]|nr:hypothetical protein [Acidobacteriota bacterium]MBP7376163.1 hypothetical protein [Pyrinomonadaceae bacterium]
MRIIRRKRITIRHTERSVEFTEGEGIREQRCPHCHELLTSGLGDLEQGELPAFIDAEVVECLSPRSLELEEQTSK